MQDGFLRLHRAREAASGSSRRAPTWPRWSAPLARPPPLGPTTPSHPKEETRDDLAQHRPTAWRARRGAPRRAARPARTPTSCSCSGSSSAPGRSSGRASTPPAARPPCAASCTSAGCSAAEPCRTSGSSPDAASPARAGRRWPSTARRSASTTPAIDAWRSTWIEPVNGRVRRFIGRPERRRHHAAQRRGRPAAALALHRHHARLVRLARRDLTRRRRDLDARRGDARHPPTPGLTLASGWVPPGRPVDGKPSREESLCGTATPPAPNAVKSRECARLRALWGSDPVSAE